MKGRFPYFWVGKSPDNVYSSVHKFSCCIFTNLLKLFSKETNYCCFFTKFASMNKVQKINLVMLGAAMALLSMTSCSFNLLTPDFFCARI
jgi:hypothetical protein